jgi:hypothetical protein
VLAGCEDIVGPTIVGADGMVGIVGVLGTVGVIGAIVSVGASGITVRTAALDVINPAEFDTIAA